MKKTNLVNWQKRLSIFIALGSILGAAPLHAQVYVFNETFTQTATPSSTTPIIRIKSPNYTGVGGVAYSGDTYWSSGDCNGWLVSWSQSTGNVSGNPGNECGPSNDVYGWNFSQQLAQVLGQLNGQTQAAARNNFAVSAYTLRGTGYTGSNGIELESSQVALAIPAGGSGRFLASSIDVAAANCEVSTAAKPLLNFSLVSPSNNETALGGTINACSSGTTFPAEARGTVTARSHTAGRYWSTAAFLYSGGSTVGLRVRNVTTFSNGDGNDHAFDNLRLIDASPTLSKSTPALTYVGQSAPITFTVTNTVDDNLAKTGWSFTDSLPAGLLVAQNPNASTTCSAATITAAAGANTISITNGSLAGGPIGGPATTCTITVDVVSNVPGSYSNGADQITSSSGLNLPQAPAVMEWVSVASRTIA